MHLLKEYIRLLVESALKPKVIFMAVISESIADRRLSSADIDYLEKIADTWAIAKEKKSKDPSGLQTVIYDFYTKSHDDYKKTMSLYDLNNKSLKDKYNTYWENVKKAIETSGQRRGWETVDGGAWTQFTKPFTGAAEHGTGNYKFYLTFTRGDNLKDFFENVAKLPTLLANINDAKTTGKVSFKIASQFGPGLHHKDNVVIHYKMATDAAALKDAVKQTGFNLMDRASVGRLDTGVDIETSDSDVVAKVAAKQLLTTEFINILNMYLSEPKGSYEYKQGLSLLNKYLSDQMEKSSHRTKRNA